MLDLTYYTYLWPVSIIIYNSVNKSKRLNNLLEMIVGDYFKTYIWIVITQFINTSIKHYKKSIVFK